MELKRTTRWPQVFLSYSGGCEEVRDQVKAWLKSNELVAVDYKQNFIPLDPSSARANSRSNAQRCSAAVFLVTSAYLQSATAMFEMLDCTLTGKIVTTIWVAPATGPERDNARKVLDRLVKVAGKLCDLSDRVRQNDEAAKIEKLSVEKKLLELAERRSANEGIEFLAAVEQYVTHALENPLRAGFVFEEWDPRRMDSIFFRFCSHFPIVYYLREDAVAESLLEDLGVHGFMIRGLPVRGGDGFLARLKKTRKGKHMILAVSVGYWEKVWEGPVREYRRYMDGVFCYYMDDCKMPGPWEELFTFTDWTFSMRGGGQRQWVAITNRHNCPVFCNCDLWPPLHQKLTRQLLPLPDNDYSA